MKFIYSIMAVVFLLMGLISLANYFDQVSDGNVEELDLSSDKYASNGDDRPCFVGGS